MAQQEAAVVELTEGLRKLSGSDLTNRLPDGFPTDCSQLGEDCHSAMERLAAVLYAVVKAAGKIGIGAGDFSRQSGNLSQCTGMQAATLEEAAAAVNLLTVNVKSAATDAHGVERVQSAQAEVSRSGTVVTRAVGAMEEIARVSTQLSTIIGVIDDIAFQTNRLALNAG